MLQGVLNAFADGLVVVDSDGIIVFTNARAVGIFGYEGHELLGQTIERLVPESARERHPGYRSHSGLQEREMASRPVRGVCKDGSETIVEVRLAPFVVDGQRYMCASVRDVGQRLLRDIERAALEHSAAFSIMAATFAHEISNAMTSAFLSIDDLRSTLAEQRPDPTAVGLSLGEIEGSLLRTQEVLQALRRMGAHQGTLRPVNVGQVLDASLLVVRSHLPASTTIVRRYQSTELAVADEGQLGQVFLNLLINAGHALADADASPRLELSVARADNRVHIDIADNGPGVPMPLRQRIFDPHFTTKKQGTGIGLAVVSGIVKRCGGEIHLVDSPVGATFRVNLSAA
jgi:PAS domain S-box-containing protein